MKNFSGELFIERLKKLTGCKTQKEVAQKLLTNETYLSQWKNGDILPSTDFLLRVSETYHCGIDYLLGIDSQIELKSTVKEVCKEIVRLDRMANFDYSESKMFSIDDNMPTNDYYISLSIRGDNRGVNCGVDSVNKFLESYFKIKECNLPDEIKKFAVDGLLQELPDYPLNHDYSRKV